MTYQRINNLTGWAVFGVALLVYLLTVSPTASFWDCGEFIACANELEVTHPPGAPLFLLMGRIMAMLSFGSETNIAFMVNLLSVFASAFTALFTFWTTTMLARKGLNNMGMTETNRTVVIMAAGVVAGLTCTFADSIWFNAVEAEVYAMSSFFTAIVVWLMFKWEARADEPDHFRYILLIAYLMGLSIGVHLLNLLTIPALALLYYYRKFDFSWKGFLATMGISVAILAFVQYGIIQESFQLAWFFEKVITGTVDRSGADTGGLGLPMGTGSTLLFLLLIALVVGGIWWSQRNKKVILNTILLGVSLIFIGFSSYALIFIRSGADTPIDMNNPENLLTFLSYMRREQYGDRPLLRGPMYNAEPTRDSRGIPVAERGRMRYMLLDGQAKYVEDMEDVEYVYDDEDVFWFPRMYATSRYTSGPFGYINYVKNQGADPNNPYDDKPTKAEDLTFFLEYQFYHMYVRYFLWNFVGREGDRQESRWESGLEWNDLLRYTPEKSQNKGKNHYYFLPLFFGLLGVVWHAISQKQDAAVIGMLFFFTGIAIVLYLNQWPYQPRERDYSYAGSFQTFAIWVGLGVLFLHDLIRQRFKQFAPWIAGGLVMIAPLLMVAENWDDHTRKGRWVDIEFAKNLLNSCEENAIIFTGGDNDTFSLWYVQEVEGYRTDVRVVNLELLLSDWYIDQMREPRNGTPGIPLSMEGYEGEKQMIIQPFSPIKVRFPLDKEQLVADGILSQQEATWAADTMEWDFKGRGRYLLRKDSVFLNMMRNVAADGWKRPVYFANTISSSNFLNLDDYLRMEGMAYRVLPVKVNDEMPRDIYYGRIGQEKMYENITEDFLFTGLNEPATYTDEHIQEYIVTNYRNTIFRLASSYAREIDRLRGEKRALVEEDSLMEKAVYDAENERLDQQIQYAQARVETLVNLADEKLPEALIPKNRALAISEIQMLMQAALPELTEVHLARTYAKALEALDHYKEAGVRISQESTDLQVALLALQHYALLGNREQVDQIISDVKRTTGFDLSRVLDQAK